MSSDPSKKPLNAVNASDGPPSTSSIDDFPSSTGSQYGSIEPHVFSSPVRAEYWRNIYEHAKYECRHRFDPSFRWTPLGEVLVKRKVIPLEPSLRDLVPFLDMNHDVFS